MAAAPPRSPKTRRSRAETQERRARAERLLGLFAWHRDAPLVAKALGLSLDELHAELDELKLRRKAYRLVRGSDADIPIVKAVPGARGGPPLRRRTRSAAPDPGDEPEESEPEPTEAALAVREETLSQDAHASAAGSEPISGPSEVAKQAAHLRALLAQVGPRRAALAARLGSESTPMPDRVLLARFRAAGLEREFAQRERDLLRGLFAHHHGSREAVAAELKLELDALERLVRERGLEPDVERLAQRFRDRTRRRR